MSEPHPRSDLDQACRLGRSRRIRSDPEPLGGTPQQRHVADRLRRCEQEYAPSLDGERLQLPHEALLDAAGQRQLAGQPESARDRDALQPARQLEQRQRVAAGLSEDPILHPLVERPGKRRFQQQPGVVIGQPVDHELRQPLELVLVAGLAQREHQSHPLRQEPARHERKRLRGHPVKPLRVVDDTHERLLLGGVGQQAQDRQPDEEAIRWRSGAQAERRAQRVALRARQMRETAEHVRAQRMQAGECELHLGLDACRPGDPASLRGCRQMPQQGGLADSRLAAEDQHTALARAHSRDESFQHVALARTVEQPRRWQVRLEQP